MGLFDSLKSMFAGSKLHPGAGDATGAMLVDAVKRYDVSSTNTVLLTTRDMLWNDRAFYLDLVSPHLVPHLGVLCDAWCGNEPHSVVPFLVRGVTRIDWAWQARGSGAGSSVGSGAASLFQQRLTLARQDLEQVMQMDPTDPTPYAFAIKIARGQDADLDVGRQLLAEACRRQPDNWLAHQQLVVAMAPKWSGLPGEAVLDFARADAARAETLSGLPALPIAAHLEVWNSQLMDVGEAAARAYFKQPAVLAELDHAIAALEQTAPMGPWATLPWNVLAYAAFVAEDAARLRVPLTHMGWGAFRYPWYYSGDLETAVKQAHKLAGIL